jgi:transposase-like protein
LHLAFAQSPPPTVIEQTKAFECRQCQSKNVVKNGTNASGNQQYHCKDCGAYGVMDPEQKGYSDEEKERILRAYRERGSLRGVERIFGVSRGTVLRWLKKRGKN